MTSRGYALPLVALFAVHCSTGAMPGDASTHDTLPSDTLAMRDGAHDALPSTDAPIDDTVTPLDVVADDTLDDTVAPLDTPVVPTDATDVAPPRDVITVDTPPPPPCVTRITYGSQWIRGGAHPADYDDVDGMVTWDGACTNDATNGYATLSNGWRPYFSGHGNCIIALDYRGSCPAIPTSCSTRITYGSAWSHPAGHSAQYDDTGEVVTWDGVCHPAGAQSSGTLSNGWTPTFNGSNACDFSFRYTQCGGLYANPVVSAGCADPGVAHDGSTYVMACTSGSAPNGFQMRTSTDLVHWSNHGYIFPAGTLPTWASGDFWAPEIHHVGTHWVAYFSARTRSDGTLAIGAASGPTSTGPFTDIGHPLIHDPNPGVIDVTEYETPAGARYLIWKTDGNQTGAHTPIHIQRLNADGLSLTGSATTLITNDQSWEGGVVEGPWMIDHAGTYYLFYSANGYASTAYAIGVARASSPLGPFTKHAGPILFSKGAWAGPGHGSVVQDPQGNWVQVYHSWIAGMINGGPGREPLVDRIEWINGWPEMLGAPSSRSQPLP